MVEKQIIRKKVWEKLLKEGVSKLTFGHIPTFEGQERAAELLRNLEIYSQAKRIFVPPDQAQLQVRFNCLKDRKILIMATPGLKDGFYEVRKDFPNWQKAIYSQQIRIYGKKLRTCLEEIGRIDLMITGAVAVSRQGERIGKGTGFFDWEYKILREIEAVDQNTPIVAVVHRLQIYEKLPFEARDVSIDYIVTPEEIIKIEKPAPRPEGIDWKFAKSLRNKMRPIKEIWEVKYEKSKD